MISITVNTKDGFASTAPDAINAQDILYAEADGSGALIHYKEETAKTVKELKIDESLSDLETALGNTDINFKKVNITKIDGIQERSVVALLNDRNIERVTAEGNGSLINYHYGYKNRPKEFTVLESPAAIVAGNTSA